MRGNMSFEKKNKAKKGNKSTRLELEIIYTKQKKNA